MLRKPLLKTGGKEEKCAANQVVSRKDVLSEAMRLFLLEAHHERAKHHLRQSDVALR